MKARWMIFGSFLTLLAIVGVVALGSVVLADDDSTQPEAESGVFDRGVDRPEDGSTSGVKALFSGHGRPEAMDWRWGQAGSMWSHKRHGADEFFERVAEIIGIEPETLRRALEDGQTLSEIAAAHGLERQELIDALLAEVETYLNLATQSGVFDPEQLAFVQGWLQDGLGLLVDHPLPVGEEWETLPRHSWHELLDAEDFDLPERLADLMGLTLDELAGAVMDGRSLAEIAQANGVEPEAVVDWLVAEAEAELDEAVAAGYLTEEQTDLLRGWVRDGAPLVVNKSLMFPGAFEMLERLGTMAGPPLAQLDWDKWAEYDWAQIIGQDPLSVAAEMMGVSRGELLEAVMEGDSLAEIAEAYGVELDALIEAQTESLETLLEDLAAEGLLPEHVPSLVGEHLDEALSIIAEEGFPFGEGHWMEQGWFECCPCDHQEAGE